MPFDEAWYLNTYPDVADAVRDGRLPSGHDHYVRFGRSEGRHPCAEPTPQQEGCAAHAHLAFPPGHYYSPIVDPGQLARAGFATRRQADPMPGIAFDYHRMERLARELLRHETPPMPKEAGESRYFQNNEMYGLGDAIVLSCFVSHLRPRRWIEVGSGFSSAVLLDTLDLHTELQTDVTFIEPDTERLQRLLRAKDHQRVEIIAGDVQDVPLETFDALDSGDVLFLDTTHVSKTGSDLNHELFRIVPRLRPGVVIHFHDIFDGFEYPDRWIYDENRSWNEQYLIRAFLMFNHDFEVLYANDGFAKQRPEVLRSLRPEILVHPGGGLWLRRAR
jgi:predicted O-methyltransferase YrrM